MARALCLCSRVPSKMPAVPSAIQRGLLMANRLLPLRDLTAPLEKDAPWPGTAVSGDPHTKTWNLHTSDDGKILAGIWESTTGVWKIDYDAWEYCHLLAGRCTVEIEGKPPVTLQAGDVFIVETGAKGTWTVHENLRKYYVFALGHSLRSADRGDAGLRAAQARPSSS